MSRRASSRRRKKDEDEDDDGTNGGASIQSNGDAKRQKTGSPDPESGPSGGKKKKAEPQEEEEEEEELIIGVDLGVPRSMTYDHWLETWENRKKKHRQEKSGLLHAMKQYNEFVKGNVRFALLGRWPRATPKCSYLAAKFHARMLPAQCTRVANVLNGHLRALCKQNTIVRPVG